jgi:hypothetical protein
MPLPLSALNALNAADDDEGLLRQARERGERLTEDLLRHREELARFRQEAAGDSQGLADGEAALDRAIEAARRLVSDIDGELPPGDHGSDERVER